MNSVQHTESFDRIDNIFIFQVTEEAKGKIGEIIGEIYKPDNLPESYTIEVDSKENAPNYETYFQLISRFIEYIQSSSEKEFRIIISINGNIPEVFYDRLIEKLKKNHADEAIKNYKENKVILICK